MNPADISTNYQPEHTSPYSPPEQALPVLKPAAPRVWTVFVAVLLALVMATFLQTLAVVVLVVWLLANGAEVAELTQELQMIVTRPPIFIALALLGQIAFGAAAIVPAKFSREPTKLRLGLVKPALPVWGYPVVALGALVPAAIGLSLAQALALVVRPDPSVARLYEQMTPDMATPFILFIALAPGFMEELLFRGYVQRRLLERWTPAIAIVVSSVVFALLHIMPHAVVFALPVGLWLGVLAWRTGSVWPGIVCHVFINGSWNVWNFEN